MRSKKKGAGVYLILTSSGGSGHLQAAKAKEYELKEKFPKADVITRDVLIDWLGKRMGRFFVSLWNNAQASGNIARLKWLISCNSAMDRTFYLPIFFKTLFTLLRHNVDHIIDTQPNFTSPFIRAAKLAGKLRSRPITIEKVITELPTSYCFHFFSPIKKLSKKDKKELSLISDSPLLMAKQTTQSFWKEQCDLSNEKVSYEKIPLRPAFNRFRGMTRQGRSFPLKLNTHGQEEKRLIEETINCGNKPYLFEKGHFHITLEPDEKIYTLMLGSIPAKRTTLKYVEQIIQTINELEDFETPYRLFVFCNDHKEGKKSLLSSLHTLILSTKDYPKNLTVIPLSFQDDKVIAPLFFRSDATFTRSGGLTSMELMAVARGQICIHSEAPDAASIEQGMPHWEFGNAWYLKEKRGAKILTTTCFAKDCMALLRAPSQPSMASV